LTSTTVVAGTLLALAACHPRPAPPDVPAVITHPTAEGREELVRVVSRALDGAAVTIADDALAGESTLIIERAVRRDAQGRPLTGRDTERPEHFQLVRSGSSCVLVHERTGRRWTLKSVTCSPR
jgi:hypothetical protein